MVKRQRTMATHLPPYHHHPHAHHAHHAFTGPHSQRTAALLASASSLFLSSGLATLTWVWSAPLQREIAADVDVVDVDEMAVVAWWTADAAFRWAVVSAGGSLCGVLGLLLGRSSLHRVFAVTTATDLLVTMLATLALASLTLSPSLSGPFGAFLCSSTFASDWTSPRTEQRASSAAWAGGIDILTWGVEACDETWQTAMLGVLLGCGVAVVLRALGTWVTWEANAEMREKEGRDRSEAWVDQADADMGEGGGPRMMRQVDEAERGGASDYKTPLALEEALGRPRSRSRSSSHSHSASSFRIPTRGRGVPGERKSHTLPLGPYELDSVQRARAQTLAYGQAPSLSLSSGSARHAQLVLVPVVLDERGNPVFQPLSPTYTLSPPHPRSRHASSSPSASSHPSPSSSSSSRSSSHSSVHRPRSSSSGSSSLASPLSSVFVDEPVELSSPPCSPVGQSSSTMTGDDKATSRRVRSRSDDVSLRSPAPL